MAKCPSPVRSSLWKRSRDSGSWCQCHILRLLYTIHSNGPARVSASRSWIKLRPGRPVSPLFIYHQPPPTTEESILPGSLLMWSRGISPLYLLTLKRSLTMSKGCFLCVCVCIVLSWLLKMQLILKANIEWNMMSWAFLFTPHPSAPFQDVHSRTFCNTIQSWVVQAFLWDTGQQEQPGF